MRWQRSARLFFILLPLAAAAFGAGLRVAVDDPDGVAGRTGAPVSIDFVPRGQLSAFGLVDARTGKPVPCQFDTWGRGLTTAVWWLMPPGPKGRRVFQFRPPAAPLAKPALRTTVAEDKSHVDIREGDKIVLRYWLGTAPLPKGIPARYACGDYIHPLCGPDGESLTEAHPRDHPHHRGVMWTWPLVRWKGQVRDPWVAQGLWSRPEKLERAVGGEVMAVFSASLRWMWGDKTPVARQRVTIRAFRQMSRCRVIDIGIGLTALVDGLSIGGRPKAGYGGFGLRMAPRKAQRITLFSDPPAAKPRRSWIEYSDTFAGGKGRVGVAIFPRYPCDLHKYPNLNYVMPAYPGPREFPLPKGKTVTLRHRLWIHPGHAEEKALADQWTVYANPPKATVLSRK